MASAILRCCCGVVKWGPVVFIVAVIGWSYYAYVLEMCIFNKEANIAQKAVYLILYHPILFLFVWSYYQCIFTATARPPRQFALSQSQIDQMEAAATETEQKDLLILFGEHLPIENRTVSGAPRYCEKCKIIKPDRCHHCSVCDICVLKMDHHCPWVNNCVSFSNYKFFVLFLGYGLLYCAFISATSLQFFIQFWTGEHKTSVGRFHILFLFFVAIMFGLSLISLFSYHCFLTCKNRSTLESFRAPVFHSGPDKEGFSLGRHGNFCEIFGDNKIEWFLPMFTSHGDGVTYPTSTTTTLAPNNSYQTMGQTPASPSPPRMGDGVTYPTRTVDNDEDGLLGSRQRWMEEGDANGFVATNNKAYDMDSIHLA